MKIRIFFPLFFLCTAAFASGDIDRKISSLCDSLAVHFPDSVKTPRLAVLPFADNTGKSQGQGVSECVIMNLQKKNRFTLVDRMEFQKVMNEIGLSQSGAMDTTAELKVGRMLSASYLLAGSIDNVFGMSRVSARIIRTETGEVVSSGAVAAAPSALDRLTKEILGEQGRITSSLFRSMAVPGWGQFYTDHPVRGTISLAAFLGGAGYLIYRAQKSADARQNWDDYSASISSDSAAKAVVSADTARTHRDWAASWKSVFAKKDALYDAYSRDYDNMIIGIAIAGGIYVLNLVDATIAGAQAKRKFRLYFSGTYRGRYGVSVAWFF